MRLPICVLATAGLTACAGNPWTDPAGYERNVRAFFQSDVGKATLAPLAFGTYVLSGYQGSTVVTAGDREFRATSWCVPGTSRCNVNVTD